MFNERNNDNGRRSSGLSRRGFLKGGVVTAAGAAIGDASLEAFAQEQGKAGGAKVIS